MLLSDRDIRAEIAAERLGIDPFDDSLVQPSSVDVRLDNLFRVFNNTRYTHIDPSIQQDELTSCALCPTISPAGWKASRRSADSDC